MAMKENYSDSQERVGESNEFKAHKKFEEIKLNILMLKKSSLSKLGAVRYTSENGDNISLDFNTNKSGVGGTIKIERTYRENGKMMMSKQEISSYANGKYGSKESVRVYDNGRKDLKTDSQLFWNEEELGDFLKNKLPEFDKRVAEAKKVRHGTDMAKIQEKESNQRNIDLDGILDEME